MDPDTAEWAGFDAFVTLGALLLVQHDMAVPGEGVFRAGPDTETFLAGNADVNDTNLGPVILDMDPGPLGALLSRLVGRGAGQHAQSAIGATLLLEFEHRHVSFWIYQMVTSHRW